MIEFYRLVAWRSATGEMRMELCNFGAWSQVRFKDGNLYTFKGTRATVQVFSYDASMTRNDALKFAQIFMDGEYVTIEIDLKTLTSRTIKGEKH